MTVRELIEHLKAVPERDKDLPVVGETGLKSGLTHKFREGCFFTFDDCGKPVIKIS